MMTALYRSLRFRELTLIQRGLKLRTIVLAGFLLIMCLSAVLMCAGGSGSDEDASGMFYQVVDKKDDERNYLETSGTALIAYGLLKGVRLGYLPKRFEDIFLVYSVRLW